MLRCTPIINAQKLIMATQCFTHYFIYCLQNTKLFMKSSKSEQNTFLTWMNFELRIYYWLNHKDHHRWLLQWRNTSNSVTEQPRSNSFCQICNLHQQIKWNKLFENCATCINIYTKNCCNIFLNYYTNVLSSLLDWSIIFIL